VTADDAGAAALGPLVDVHLVRLPVRLWARSQEHGEELLREFALMATDPTSSASVPTRLTRLVQELTATYAGLGAEQEAQLFAAAAAGVEEDDVRFRMPVAVADACIHLGAMLDEADEFCRAGEHLLTLATPPDLRRFRAWYLGEFVTQIGGAPPVPWPAYDSA
jgi:hypothetical protein